MLLLTRPASVGSRFYSTVPPNTIFGLPNSQNNLNQVKKYSMVEFKTNHLFGDRYVVNMSVSMTRMDRIHFIRAGPTITFPAYELELTVCEEDGTQQTRRFNLEGGTYHAFLHERNIRMHNGRPCIEFHMNDKAISAWKFSMSTMYRLYTDLAFSNPQMMHLLYRQNEPDESSAIIEVSSENTSADGFFRIAPVEKLMKSQRWCIRMDQVKFLLLIRSNDRFYIINMFCFHLGNSLFGGKLFSDGGTQEDQVNGKLLECPQCEFKFTDLIEASYDVRIDNDNILWANLDLVGLHKTGRPIMSNIENMQSFIDLHRVKRSL